MSKSAITFKDFIATVPADQKQFINELHEYLMDQECKIMIKEAKSGYVISYIGLDKKTIFNYIFRKTGMQMRIYANHVHEYPHILETLPDNMKDLMNKAKDCKRLLDPNACNSRCPMGYDYTIAGKRYQKCRNSAFQFPLSEEHNPFLQIIVKRETEALTLE